MKKEDYFKLKLMSSARTVAIWSWVGFFFPVLGAFLGFVALSKSSLLMDESGSESEFDKTTHTIAVTGTMISVIMFALWVVFGTLFSLSIYERLG